MASEQTGKMTGRRGAFADIQLRGPKMNAQNIGQSPNLRHVDQPSGDSRPRPWRTEGRPKGQPAKRRRWVGLAVWGAAYLILFVLLTMQDRLAAPEAVSYTEFKAQVAADNVAEVFARGDAIQGALKKSAPLPKQEGRTYLQFKTERPTFAADDLLTQLAAGNTTV